MAAISGERANDERVKCLRIFADGNGETHMEDIDIRRSQKSFSDQMAFSFCLMFGLGLFFVKLCSRSVKS